MDCSIRFWRILRILLIVCIFLFNVFNIGAGSSSFPEGDGVKSDGVKPVSHGLNLPPGYALPAPSSGSLPEISTDYQNHFPNPKSFEHPKEILSKGLLPKNRLVSFLFMYNSKVDVQEIEKLAGLYMKEGDYEGVNYDIAFVQMCLETGFLKFNGDVKRNQNNFCGLGAVGNGATGMSFVTMEVGVRAHIQHLKAYASRESIKNEVVDGRTQMVKRGSATNIHDLTGKWAVDPFYGKKLDYLLTKIYDGAHILKPKTSILFD